MGGALQRYCRHIRLQRPFGVRYCRHIRLSMYLVISLPFCLHIRLSTHLLNFLRLNILLSCYLLQLSLSISLCTEMPCTEMLCTEMLCTEMLCTEMLCTSGYLVSLALSLPDLHMTRTTTKPNVSDSYHNKTQRIRLVPQQNPTYPNPLPHLVPVHRHC